PIRSFWLVTALAMIGETERAHALCQKLLSFAGPLQLYAEEIDATTGQHLGNFPQAFKHLALIEAVSLLIESDRAGRSGPSYTPPPPIRRTGPRAERGTAPRRDERSVSPAGPAGLTAAEPDARFTFANE